MKHPTAILLATCCRLLLLANVTGFGMTVMLGWRGEWAYSLGFFAATGVLDVFSMGMVGAYLLDSTGKVKC